MKEYDDDTAVGKKLRKSWLYNRLVFEEGLNLQKKKKINHNFYILLKTI